MEADVVQFMSDVTRILSAIEQASEVLGISRATAHRYCTYSRAFLHRQISDADEA
jgi:response regulator of citrate/malate metabolism